MRWEMVWTYLCVSAVSFRTTTSLLLRCVVLCWQVPSIIFGHRLPLYIYLVVPRNYFHYLNEGCLQLVARVFVCSGERDIRVLQQYPRQCHLKAGLAVCSRCGVTNIKLLSAKFSTVGCVVIDIVSRRCRKQTKWCL